MAPDLHPDANLIGAMLEGSLPAAERGALMQHFADCAPCRRWLVCAQAANARPGRAVAPTASAVWRLGWEAPLATAASLAVVVTAVWLALPARVSAPPAPAPPLRNVAAAPPAFKTLPLGTVAVAKPQLQAQALRPMASPALLNNRTVAASLPLAPAILSAAPPPVVEIQPSIDFSPLMTGFLDQAPPRPAMRSQLAAFEPDVRPATNATAASAGTAPPLGLSFQGGGALSGPLAPAFATTLGWAISRSGQVLKSVGTDLWAAVPLVPGLHVHALSSTDTAIWAGGMINQLYVSRDTGVHWQRISLPGVDSANAAVPISSIIFADGQHGLVTAADGHTWATQDGGKTWTRSGN